jgi:hypothetical protein
VRARLVVSVLVVAAAVATPAGGERQAGLLVRHGESIGKVKLGMTLLQVRHMLGRERAVNKRERRGTRGFGFTYLELDWDYGWWTVGFMRSPRGGVYRVVSIETLQRGQRTPEGLGVGSRESGLQRRLAHLRCRSVYAARRDVLLHVECVYGAQRERQTAFPFSSWRCPAARCGSSWRAVGRAGLW